MGLQEGFGWWDWFCWIIAAFVDSRPDCKGYC
jgi:hypothetical protein